MQVIRSLNQPVNKLLFYKPFSYDSRYPILGFFFFFPEKMSLFNCLLCFFMEDKKNGKFTIKLFQYCYCFLTLEQLSIIGLMRLVPKGDAEFISLPPIIKSNKGEYYIHRIIRREQKKAGNFSETR